MCGFTGFYNFTFPFQSNNHAIREMIEIQKHRGPDDSGIIGINTLEKNFETISVESDADFRSEKKPAFWF